MLWDGVCESQAAFAASTEVQTSRAKRRYERRSPSHNVGRTTYGDSGDATPFAAVGLTAAPQTSA